MPSLSLAQLESAWLHVEANGGCAGVDAITVERFAAHADAGLRSLFEEIATLKYRPLPLLRIDVQKHDPAGGVRHLLVPAVRDRIAETAVAHALAPTLEDEFTDSSFAYRPGRGVNSALARVTQLRDRGFRWGIRADIESFFDSIPRAELEMRLAADSITREYTPLIHAWLRAPYWDGGTLVRTHAGIPQGSPLSPLLSNFFLEPFDAALGQGDFHLVRYGDDILLLGPAAEAVALAEERARAALASLDLRLKETKTEEIGFETGFHFLGAFFLRQDVYLPWGQNRPKTRVVAMARPMPAQALAHYRHEPRGGRPRRAAAAAAAAGAGQVSSAHPRSNAVAFLYITEQGSVVRKSGDRILVEAEGAIALDLPYHKLESILLFGNVQITSAAMTELLDKGVTLSLFTRQGRYRGTLTPPTARDVELRLAHFELYRDPAAAFAVARTVVRGKVANAAETLRRERKRDGSRDLGSVLTQLEHAGEATAAAGAVQALDGIEGSAAREYFFALMAFNKSVFTWPGRVKHPATDPINALLSLTYTLLTHEIAGLLEAAGLDPYLGFLHQLDYGRQSLALDLVEAFRNPVADRFVIACINQNMFAPEDFQPGPDREGLFLRHDSIKRYFSEFEKWMCHAPASRPSYRQSLRAEVEAFKRAVGRRSIGEWKPFDFGAVQAEE